MLILLVAVLAVAGTGTAYAFTRSASTKAAGAPEAYVARETAPSGAASSISPTALTASETTAPTSAPESAPSPAGDEQTAAPLKAATWDHDPYPQLLATNGEIRLPLSTFDDGVARHYTYMDGDQPIELFMLKSADGVVRAAFNACDVCFRALMGYHQDGDEMVCGNCGQRFPSNKINVVQGGCNPAPLRRAVDGDTLVIQVDDIVEGARFF